MTALQQSYPGRGLGAGPFTVGLIARPGNGRSHSDLTPHPPPRFEVGLYELRSIPKKGFASHPPSSRHCRSYGYRPAAMVSDPGRVDSFGEAERYGVTQVL